MKTPGQLALFLAIVIAVCAAGCQHASQGQITDKADLGWREYGDPGPGKITVIVGGYVRHPGRYHLDSGVTLAAIPNLVGGWSKCPTCGNTPHWVWIKRATDNNQTAVRYTLTESHETEIRAVTLSEGDRLDYGVAHW